MYTVQQLQIAEYLLKSQLADEPYYAKENKTLKIVIENLSNYWYGDFITFEREQITQYEITSGIRKEVYTYANSNFIKKIWDEYYSVENRLTYYTNPKYLTLLFHKLLEIISKINIQPDDSPIYPYLLNAKSLDGRLELPFINIGNEKVKVISLIEVPNQD